MKIQKTQLEELTMPSKSPTIYVTRRMIRLLTRLDLNHKEYEPLDLGLRIKLVWEMLNEQDEIVANSSDLSKA